MTLISMAKLAKTEVDLRIFPAFIPVLIIKSSSIYKGIIFSIRYKSSTIYITSRARIKDMYAVRITEESLKKNCDSKHCTKSYESHASLVSGGRPARL